MDPHVNNLITLEANLKNVLGQGLDPLKLKTFESLVMTGSRSLTNIPYAYFNYIMSKTCKNNTWRFIIHGDADGADKRISSWAYAKAIAQVKVPVSDAEWKEHGGKRGPIRNSLLADLASAYSKEDTKVLAVSFWDGSIESTGTPDATRKFKKAGLACLELNFLTGEVFYNES